VNDPIRRRLIDLATRAPEGIDRDQAADALAIPRGTAAFHLDRLVQVGLLTVEFSRRSGRTGPGSGRPAKLYRRSALDIAVSLPPRSYDLAGELLASSIEESTRTGEAARDALTRVAQAHGRELGRNGASLEATLEAIGYEPRATDDGGIILSNCPFHRLASTHTELICHANLGLLQGVTDGAGDGTHEAVFEPTAEHCCVRLVTAPGARQ
jgi:predicted ArsR family transcriptional regulator